MDGDMALQRDISNMTDLFGIVFDTLFSEFYSGQNIRAMQHCQRIGSGAQNMKKRYFNQSTTAPPSR